MGQKDNRNWFKRGIPDDANVQDLLTPSRQEMYSTLQLFHAHVRYVITIILTLITAMFAILSLPEKLGSAIIIGPETMKTVVAWFFLFGIAPAAMIGIFIIWRYYLVYLSSLVFAARLHSRSPFRVAHPWFVRTINQVEEWSGIKDDIGFIKRRAKSPSDTFMLYTYILLFFVGLSLLCGLTILGILPF
jgi:hypothetical protein